MQINNLRKSGRGASIFQQRITKKNAGIGEQPGYRADIEGMRAVAVALVVAFHFGVHRLPGGFIGVDVFYVISGYLITGILTRELIAGDRIDLLRFYGRRAKRLLPAAFLVTACTLAAGWFILSPLEQGETARAARASSLYVSNFWFAERDFNYFASKSALNPFLHTWSLGVEEQFYLMWPALLLLAHRFGRGRFALATAVAVVTALSFALCLWLTPRQAALAFYGAPSRAWEFGIGALAGSIPAAQADRLRRGLPALGWLGLIVLMATACRLRDDALFPGWIAAIPVLAAAAVLVSGSVPARGGPSALLGLAPFQAVGRLSYSIYLWHWPFAVLGAAVLGDLDRTDRLGLLAATLACAWLGYTLLENPVRRGAWIGSRPSRAVAMGMAMTACSALIATGAIGVAHRASLLPDLQASTRAARLFSVSASDPRKCLPGLRRASVAICRYGTAGAPRLILFGDSHADQWSTPLAALARRGRIELVTILKSSCPAASVPSYNTRLKRRYWECDTWRKAAMRTIVGLHPQTVVIGEIASSYLQPQNSFATVTQERWTEGLTASVRPLVKAGAHVVVIRDPPRMRVDVPMCIARAIWRGVGVDCGAPRADVAHDDLARAERHAVSRIAGATYLDLTDAFCSADRCRAQGGGRILYRDSHHVATEYAATFEPVFAKAIGL